MKKKKKENLEIKEEEIIQEDNYKSHVRFIDRIPYPIKAIVLKYWFLGLGYYLIMNGIGYFFQDETYTVIALLNLALGLCYGVFFDIFLYNIYDVIETYEGQRKPYILFKRKNILSLLINVVYGIILAISSTFIGALFMQIEGNPGFGAEAFSYALIALILDAIVLSIKNLIIYLIHRKED